MALRTLFKGTALMMITVFGDSTIRTAEYVTNAIQEMSVGRIVIEVSLFSKGNLLGKKFITTSNPPYLFVANLAFPQEDYHSLTSFSLQLP